MRTSSQRTAPMPGRARIGLGLLALQLLYLPVELLVIPAVPVPYDLVGSTISELGVLGCGETPGPLPAVCSPWHPLMNATFVASGVLLVVGAVLARPALRPGAAGTAAAVCWAVTGLGTLGTGLVPLDVSVDVHLLVSNPVFAAQPPALLLTARALGRRRPVLATTGTVAGLVGAVAAVVFLTGGLPGGDGVLERLVLWPATLWLGASSVVQLVTGRTAGR